MNIFLDFDNTIVESNKKIIECLNKRYGCNKTEADMVDYNFKAICPVPIDEIKEIFASDDFFEGLEFKPNAAQAIIEFYPYITIATKGTYENLNKKYKWISTYFPDIKFIGLESDDVDKRAIDMEGGIHIDDNYESLMSSNAEIKILFKSGNNYDWQQTNPGDEVYIVNTWEEIIDILRFFKEYTYKNLIKR